MLKYWDTENNKFFICSKWKINYFRCPKIWAHCSLIVMCLNNGAPKSHHFPFGTNKTEEVLGVPILKNFRVKRRYILHFVERDCRTVFVNEFEKVIWTTHEQLNRVLYFVSWYVHCFHRILFQVMLYLWAKKSELQIREVLRIIQI